LIAVVVAMAAFMEVLDTSIANVALPHIAGNLGASLDQGTWVPPAATSWGEGRANAGRKKWKNFPLSVQNGHLVNEAMGEMEQGLVICGNALNSPREPRGYAHSHHVRQRIRGHGAGQGCRNHNSGERSP
jgi:hypothetical protein